jgi:diacylglycerol kinase (ATP)
MVARARGIAADADGGELLNTAVEKLSEHVTPENSQAIKVVKDLGSAAVMLTLTATFLIWACAIAARFW